MLTYMLCTNPGADDVASDTVWQLQLTQHRGVQHHTAFMSLHDAVLKPDFALPHCTHTLSLLKLQPIHFADFCNR